MPAGRAYLSFGRNDFPRRRQGSEDLGVSWISAGGGGAQPWGAATHSAPPHWELRRRARRENKGSILNFVGGNCSAPRLAQPCRTPGTRFGGNQGPEPFSARTKQLCRGAQPPVPPPANLRASLWAPADPSGPAVGSLPRPPASDCVPGAPVSAAAAAASPWPGVCLARPLRTPRPYRSARLVPRQCQCAARVPASEAPPRGLPRAGPRAPGSGLRTRLGRLGCWLAASRGFRAGSGCRARGGRGRGKLRQLQLQAPELQLQPRARRPPSASACEANLPPRPPLSMPSAAGGEPELPAPSHSSLRGTGDPPPRLRGQVVGDRGKALCRGGDAGAKSRRKTMCKGRASFMGCGKFVP